MCWRRSSRYKGDAAAPSPSASPSLLVSSLLATQFITFNFLHEYFLILRQTLLNVVQYSAYWYNYIYVRTTVAKKKKKKKLYLPGVHTTQHHYGPWFVAGHFTHSATCDLCLGNNDDSKSNTNKSNSSYILMSTAANNNHSTLVSTSKYNSKSWYCKNGHITNNSCQEIIKSFLNWLPVSLMITSPLSSFPFPLLAKCVDCPRVCPIPSVRAGAAARVSSRALVLTSFAGPLPFSLFFLLIRYYY